MCGKQRSVGKMLIIALKCVDAPGGAVWERDCGCVRNSLGGDLSTTVQETCPFEVTQTKSEKSRREKAGRRKWEKKKVGRP